MKTFTRSSFARVLGILALVLASGAFCAGCDSSSSAPSDQGGEETPVLVPTMTCGTASTGKGITIDFDRLMDHDSVAANLVITDSNGNVLSPVTLTWSQLPAASISKEDAAGGERATVSGPMPYCREYGVVLNAAALDAAGAAIGVELAGTASMGTNPYDFDGSALCNAEAGIPFSGGSVIFRGEQLAGIIDAAKLSPDDPNYWIYKGFNKGGVAFNMGDLDGSGLADFLGSDTVTQLDGSVIARFFLFGSYAEEAPRLTGLGSTLENQQFIGATSIQTGDVNRDGKRDIVMVECLADKTSPCFVRLIMGSDALAAETTLAAISIPIDSFDLAYTDMGAPTPVAVGMIGDHNGDGYDDAAVAFFNGEGVGELRLYAGNADPYRIVRSATSYLVSPYPLDAIAAGDLNGDGFSDMVVRQVIQSLWKAPVAAVTTNATILFGGPDAIADGTLGRAAHLIANAGVGTTKGMQANLVMNVGDFNGDNRADLVIGNEMAGNLLGKVFIILGRDAWPAQLDASDMDENDGMIVGTADELDNPLIDRVGMQVLSAHDINNDGYDDILMRARDLVNLTGTYCVFLGGPSFGDAMTCEDHAVARILLF